MAAVMLRRTDARVTAAIGFVFISIACLLVAHTITPEWGPEQFVTSQLLQAVGQSLALSGIIFFGVLHLRPQDALTFGAMLQTARLMGGEIGSSFISTFSRVREQRASNLLGQYIQTGDWRVFNRLQFLGHAVGHAPDPDQNGARAVGVLGGLVRRLATTQGLIDCFMLIAIAVGFTLAALALTKPAPEGPASHIPLSIPRPLIIRRPKAVA
jgi:DHA2 family multidrug resistance protein